METLTQRLTELKEGNNAFIQRLDNLEKRMELFKVNYSNMWKEKVV